MLGSHYDQYVIQYTRFETTVDSSSFNVTDGNCISFPGPGNTLAMAENPMFEFVGNPSYDAKHQSHKVDKEFSQFKETHNRQYETEKEEQLRKFNFRHNHR